MRRALTSFLALLLVGSIYGLALLWSRLRGRPRAVTGATLRVAVVGTFYNENWFISHATPLARSGIAELLIVTDHPLGSVERVKVLCPPAWTVRLFGRTLAKLGTLLLAGVRQHPDLYMGYHIMPCAVMALAAGRAFGRPTSYQMTGGPIEVLGGGVASENPVLRRLGPSGRRLEGLAIRMIREFDQVVVRGRGARQFLLDRGVDPGRVAIIPGSVDPAAIVLDRPRRYDLVFVGRLTELKQPLQFVEILAGVSRKLPGVQALVIGDGPLQAAMRVRAAELGVASQLEFAGKTGRVLALLPQARVFVLTSRTEGLSIAMAEAMMAGDVPVVGNVGDLGDLVQDGKNGYLVEPNDLATYVERILSILVEPGLWSSLSEAAVASARGQVSLDLVTALWSEQIAAVLRRPAGMTGASPRRST
ncbi:MAG TPA: glycosyltransferase family 4 protein [Vicinamibacteria bacterium]|nr:glycosyltransferase family 4 protein [Vicinamibacteria bacterium]